jgi:hypothetical protein
VLFLIRRAYTQDGLALLASRSALTREAYTKPGQDGAVDFKQLFCGVAERLTLRRTNLTGFQKRGPEVLSLARAICPT